MMHLTVTAPYLELEQPLRRLPQCFINLSQKRYVIALFSEVNMIRTFIQATELLARFAHWIVVCILSLIVTVPTVIPICNTV